MHRRIEYHDPAYLRCLNCYQPLRRVEILRGEAIATCEAKRRAPGSNDTKRCGQSHLVLLDEDVATVIAVTPAGLEQIRETWRAAKAAHGRAPTRSEVYLALKILRQPGQRGVAVAS
jgi:hypothetical protein